MTLNGCSKKMCPMQVGGADNCSLTKEQCPYFTQDIDYQKVLKQIKAIVAREIFEDIDIALHNMAMEYADAGHKTYFAVCEMVHHKVMRPIEKKYTEDQNDG